MAIARGLLLHTALVLSSLLHAAAVTAQVSTRALWDEHVRQAAEIDASGSAARRKTRRSPSERLALVAGGALLRSEKEEEPEVQPTMPGSVAWRFMARDGLEHSGAAFAGASTLSNRLTELHTRCPGALGQGWILLDAGEDTERGHHWVLQGPGAKGRALLHVSSAAKPGLSEGHAALSFSPSRLCRQLPAAMIEKDSEVPSATAQTQEDSEPQVDELELAMVSNQNVKDSIALIVPELIRRTQCCPHNEASALCTDVERKMPGPNKIVGAEALSATTEIDGGLTVRVTMALNSSEHPETNETQTHYHDFALNWHLCGHGQDCTATAGFALSADERVVLPTDGTSEVGWCELLTGSTVSGMASLVDKSGPHAPKMLLQKLGFLPAYRDYRPEPSTMFEKSARARKSASCVGVNDLPNDHDPRVSNADCFARETVQNQGTCGSCWAFAVAQSLAERACMKHKSQLVSGGGRKSFSKQQMMSCNTAKYGCKGGSFAPGFDEAAKGIAFEEDYPYYPPSANSAAKFPWHRFGHRCQWGTVRKPYWVTSHYTLNKEWTTRAHVNDLKQELFCKGPTAIGFVVKSNFAGYFDADPKTVYTGAASTATGVTDMGGHAGTLVGWGTSEVALKNVDFWLLTHSWGPDFADNGYFRMERGVNVCLIETMAIHAGDIEQTSGSWMYDGWTQCPDAATENTTTSRPIKCKANDGTSAQANSFCPNGESNALWPHPAGFPQKTSEKHQEIEAFKSCVDTPASCTRINACYGSGDANLTEGGCKCSCDKFYFGFSCNECATGASGWPECRENCKAEVCNNHGTPSGNVWTNEFGAGLDNCQCSCNEGFKGDSCNQCSNEVTHKYPACHGSAVVNGWNPTGRETAYSPNGNRSTGNHWKEWTKTKLKPPCRVDRGPIELMPPQGNHWIVYDCDVRLNECVDKCDDSCNKPNKAQCDGKCEDIPVHACKYQDKGKCKCENYAQFCSWRNTTAFPAGQCLSKESAVNSTHGSSAAGYHAKINGTDVAGEHFGDNVPKVSKPATR